MSDQRSAPSLPSVRAYALAIRDDEVLLVRARSRGVVPSIQWWLPGGGVDFLESPIDAVVREVLEETGLHARSPELLDVLSDVRTRQNGQVVHSVRVIYRVELVEGELIHEVEGSTDLAQWISLLEVHSMDLAPYTREVIERFAQTK